MDKKRIIRYKETLSWLNEIIDRVHEDLKELLHIKKEIEEDAFCFMCDSTLEECRKNHKIVIKQINDKNVDLFYSKHFRDELLQKCNHDMLLVYKSANNMIGPMLVAHCLVCDETIYIPWDNDYLKTQKFDFDSVIDISDLVKEDNYEECIYEAKEIFNECLYDNVTDREEIKKEIREEIVRLNKNSVKVKKLK